MTSTLRLRPPMTSTDEAGMDRGPLLAEAGMSALHSSHEPFTLSIQFRHGKVGLFASASETLLPLVRQQLYAQYPESEIENVSTDQPKECVTREMILTSSELLPIKTYPAFVDSGSRRLVDPLAGIISALDGEPAASVQITLTPAHHIRRRCQKAMPILDQHLAHRWHAYGAFLTRLKLTKGGRRWLLLPVTRLLCKRRQEDPHPEAEDKINRLLFHTSIRLTVAGTDKAAHAKMHELIGAFEPFTLPNCNGFRAVRRTRPYLLSAQEVATLWHVPGPLSKAAGFDWLQARKLEIPVHLPSPDEEGVNVIGEAIFRQGARRFGIRADDRRRHLYVIGKSGTGKTTLLENMIYQDVKQGRGVSVIDPHGDLVEACLQFIPKSRQNSVIYLDPSDVAFPFGYNPLDATPEQRPFVASAIVSTMARMYPDVWSARASYITRNVINALLESENTTMLGVLRLLTDKPYRRKILSTVKNDVVRGFFDNEYEMWPDKYRTEAIATIQNKLGGLMSIPLVKNILGQARTRIDLRSIMDSEKILLVNLSRGRTGGDVSQFLGSMLVTAFELAALSRAQIPHEKRVDHYLVVDEFHAMISESFVNMAAEARKFKLNLTISHQFVNQLLLKDKNTILRDAVFGNIGSIVSFALGAEDAEFMCQQMEGLIRPEDILSLPKYTCYTRLMVDGMATKPFSVRTFPRPEAVADEERVETIKRLTRDRYCQPRETVERQIRRWMDQPALTSKNKPITKRAQRQA